MPTAQCGNLGTNSRAQCRVCQKSQRYVQPFSSNCYFSGPPLGHLVIWLEVKILTGDTYSNSPQLLHFPLKTRNKLN